MSIFDGDANPINIPMKTAGGKIFWNNLFSRGGYTLQRHIFTEHCRILNSDDVRVAWGEEGPMRAKLLDLCGENEIGRPKRGDVIGVHRIGGVYDHYGIYESDDCVYEYAAKNHDFGEANIHQTTLKGFIKDSGNFFILVFPDKHGSPGKLAMPVVGNATNIIRSPSLDIPLILLNLLSDSTNYHLYSPDETIKRAKSRLGETQYNLMTNNCEHFAIWCKTGIHESHQVEIFLRRLKTLSCLETV